MMAETRVKVMEKIEGGGEHRGWKWSCCVHLEVKVETTGEAEAGGGQQHLSQVQNIKLLELDKTFSDSHRGKASHVGSSGCDLSCIS